MTTVAKAMVGAKHAAENVLQAATMFAPKKFDFKHTTDPDGGFTRKEVENASHNHGIHPEALVYDVTPTGLHYILRHFDTPCLEPGQVESGRFHLSILGLVENRLSLSLEDIKSRPSVTHRVVMECSGNGRTRMTPRYNIHTPWNVEGVGCAEWKGTPLKPLLEEAGLKPEARDIVFVGLDKGVCEGKLRYFERSIRANDPILEDCFLAYEMNGRPLEPQHGYPLRLIVPGWYGMMSIKWLQAIEVIDHVFQGYWNQTYSYTKEERDVEVLMPVTEMKPKALIVPPGVLMMETHHRIIEQGAHKLQGRCWVGGKGNSIAKVEVSFDDGKTWDEATVAPKPAELPFTWQKWTYPWLAIEGTYSFRLRATDSRGATQPLEVDDTLWNYHGLGNNVAISMTFVVVKKYDLEVEWKTSESSVTRAFLKLVGER